MNEVPVPWPDALTPLPELDGAPRYRGFTWDEFMAARVADSYADIGDGDAQISDYLIDA